MSVQNVLQGILSQKVVADGSGYAVKNDLVNIDTVNISSTSTQAGSITTSSSDDTTDFIISGVTSNSIVVLTPKSVIDTYYWVTTSENKITITLASAKATTFNYYIAKY
jgi:hypothetical protein